MLLNLKTDSPKQVLVRTEQDEMLGGTKLNKLGICASFYLRAFTYIV
jgi:hypothetical protein